MRIISKLEGTARTTVGSLEVEGAERNVDNRDGEIIFLESRARDKR